MRNDIFWEQCNNNSIRQKVATFIDSSPILSHFKGEKYYQLEDALVSFIEKNRELIYREVDKEYFREDVVSQIREKYHDDGEPADWIEAIPTELLDKIVDEWQERLADNDVHNESNWDTLTDVLTKNEAEIEALKENKSE